MCPLISRNSLIVWFLVFTAGCVTRNDPPTVPLTDDELVLQQRAFDTKITRPFLWQIEKDDKISFLFGTFHLGIDSNADIPLLVWKKLNQTKVFVMEADPNEAREKKDSNIEKWAEKIFIKKGTPTLHEQLSDAAWTKLCARVTIPPKVLNMLKPEVAADLYLAPAIFINLTSTPRMLDLDLLAYAKNLNHRVLYLEDRATAERVLIDLQPKAITAGELEKIIVSGEANEIRKTRKEYYELLHQYRSGSTSSDELPVVRFDYTYYDTLITERNKAWMPKISQCLQSGGCFIAVGVAHMLGEKSLIKEIRKLGYRVKRVSTSAP